MTINNKYTLDTSKMSIGQVFKSYKKMCEALDQKYITGSKSSRNAQLKEWKRYIDWEKDGQKIIITDIYPTPLDKTDGRVTNGNQKYQRFIEDILLAYFDSALSYTENKLNNKNVSDVIQLQLTLNQIMYVCGMVNDNYINKNIKSILLDMDYSMFNINDFFTRTKSKFNSIISSAIESMAKRKIINYKKEIVIVQGDTHRLATVDEEDIITNIEKQVLKDMECESIVNVFLSYRLDEYNRRIDKYIKSEYGWDSIYRCYSIRVNRLRINIEKEYLKITNQNNKLELNQKLTAFFNAQVENKILKESNGEFGDFKLPSDYQSQQSSLSDYLLNIKNTNK
jgi:hypothetical protein